ncbi:MAG: undecaprenyl-diphosphatase [Acidocella sp. 20-57-95]|nr:MAG: undecaprenyl-diphosphatase [Acidocella sp. 20-57-95]OYV57154.1 MAG: undecaprenyl-diphosphatase [Acidocella sp. 21-58-7]HQT63420.1 undecaprenyl-diphosphate phosphatase [Acidocella sp.]HQU04921.1 undecaprenyl-diphosphate phosphatase [Acidocella sp.]
MDFLHAILFAILQGATELFPVSSLGHAVIVPALLRWNIDQAAEGFLPFLVMLHFGTAIGLLAYFWQDWLAMLRGLLGRGYAVEVTIQRNILARLVVATLPAVVIGLLVKKPVQHLFASPLIACLFLIANAGVLMLGEMMRTRSAKYAETVSYTDAFIIGLFQCLAFLPGISRSGAAIVGALRRGVPHEAAAKFSFLMGTPVIFAASVLEIPKLLKAHELHALFGISLVAAIIAGVVAYASTAFLMRYFRDHDAWALKPFAWYCAIFGAASFAMISVGL